MRPVSVVVPVPQMRYIGIYHKGDAMSKTAMIRARVEPALKDRAESMLQQLGLSATTAITLFYRQIVVRRGLPFELHLPNAETRRAIQDARTGRGVVAAGSMEELRAKLDAPNRSRARSVKRRRAHGTR